MKKVVKGILLMSILTMIYIGAVVYADSNSASRYSADGWVLAADEYEGQPSSWYTPEELGMTVYREGNGWVQVVVPYNVNCTELREQRPIFKYKDRFYQISESDITPAVYEETTRWQILAVVVGACIATGWIYVGYLGLRKRRKGNEKE